MRCTPLLTALLMVSGSMACASAGPRAEAERLKITAVEPNTTAQGQPLTDGASCTLSIRQGSAQLAQIDYSMSSPTGGQTRDHYFPDLSLIKAMTGVVQRCQDLAGNVSVESPEHSFTFPTPPPDPSQTCRSSIAVVTEVRDGKILSSVIVPQQTICEP